MSATEIDFNQPILDGNDKPVAGFTLGSVVCQAIAAPMESDKTMKFETKCDLDNIRLRVRGDVESNDWGVVAISEKKLKMLFERVNQSGFNIPTGVQVSRAFGLLEEPDEE